MFPVKLHFLTSNFSFSDLVSKERSTIKTSWDGSINPWKFEAALAIDPENIFLIGKGFSKKPLKPSQTTSKYFEGLWEYEVIEFFFAIEDSKYIEYHLSPDGLWWAHSFTDPRVRSKHFKIPDVDIYDETSADSWLTILKIRKKDFLGDLSGSVVKMNITATFRGETPPHASLAILSGEKPNFHQPEKFISVDTTLFACPAYKS